MAHERQNLRAAIVAQIKGPANNRTTAGARVYPSRMHPLRSADLPAILIYIESETVSEGSAVTSPRELKRMAEVKVEGWVMTPPGVATDDALDALALQIETAMDIDLNLDGNAFDSQLQSTEIGIKIEGDQSMGAVALTYAVTYHSDIRVTLPVDNFEEANTQISLGGTQATADRANDSIAIPT